MRQYLRVTAFLLAGLMTTGAAAQSVADFYKGKQVTMVISYGPGGGYDVYGRIVARYIGKYIPGNPNVIVQNMPGAGSLVGANYIYNLAPKDGTTLGTFARNVPLIGLIATNQNVKFDPMKFTWIGSSSSGANDAYLFVARKDASAKSLEDARRKDGPPIVLGSTAEGVSSDSMATLLRDILGVNLKIIAGYRDGAELYLAVERKEIEARMVGYSSGRSSRPGWFAPDSFMHVLMVMGRPTRHPDLADVPTARELARSDRDRSIIEVLELPYATSRPFAAPPDVPADRAKALNEAFMAAHRDPELLAEAVKLKIDISPIDGPEVLRLIKGISSLPPDLMKSLEKLITEGGG